jgi:uncharacterized protein (TIGR03382 family)
VSYLLYDLSAITGHVDSATLTLYARNDSHASGSAVGVYAVADTTWNEDGLAWGTRPAVGDLLGTTPDIVEGETVTVDVTAAVRAGRRAAFALQGTGDDGAHFSSKEDEGGARAAVLTVRTSAVTGDDTGVVSGNDTAVDGGTESGGAGDDTAAGPEGQSLLGVPRSTGCGCEPVEGPSGTAALAGLLALGLHVRRRRGTSAA